MGDPTKAREKLGWKPADAHTRPGQAHGRRGSGAAHGRDDGTDHRRRRSGRRLSRSAPRTVWAIGSSARCPRSIHRRASSRRTSTRSMSGWSTSLTGPPCSALLESERPDEIYNLASISSVAASWSAPIAVAEVNGVAFLGLLEAVRTLQQRRRLRTTDPAGLLGGDLRDSGVPPAGREATRSARPIRTRVAKAFAHFSAVNCRLDAYGMFVSTAILFNHESPLRPSAIRDSQDHSEAPSISPRGARTSSSWGGSTSGGTGEPPKTTSGPCTWPSSTTNRGTTSWQRVNRTR